MIAADLSWMRDRVEAESPESVLDVGGLCAPRLGLSAGSEVLATGSPPHPKMYDRVVSRGRWPRVDVVVAELELPTTMDLTKFLDTWDRCRKASRKCFLAHVPYGQGYAFGSDAAVHRALPGVVASDGRGLYAVSPLGR